MDKKFKTTTVSLSFRYLFSLYIFLTIVFTLFFSHQQIITGTIVNSMLFTASLYLDDRYLLPLAIFPSLLAVLQGLLFGPLTIFLIFFLPFIWLGNYILMKLFKKNYTGNNFIYSLTVSSLAKSFIIFSSAFIYTNLHLVPKIFLQSMGIMQLATAVFGGISFFIINKIINAKRN